LSKAAILPKARSFQLIDTTGGATVNQD